MNHTDEADERFDEGELLHRIRSLRDEPSRAAHLLYQDVYDEPVELTRPEWLDEWKWIRPHFRRMYPAGMANQMDRTFASIQTTDPELYKLRLRDSQRVVFLLGAGASKPDPSSLPTVGELLPELWRRGEKLGREDLRNLQEWCEENRITNIEDLLTAAYIANFSSRSSSVLSLLRYFLFRDGVSAAEPRARRLGLTRTDASAIALLQDTLQTLFGLLLGRMISAQPNRAHEAIVGLSKETGEVGVVTTNYDGCIDQAFSESGVGANYSLEAGRADDGAALVKMHGSINWAYCESCQERHVYELAQLRGAYDDDTLGFPVIGICKNCGGQRRPMVVPPMSFKFVQFPPLLLLWDKAERELSAADVIVAVGYSFSEADTYITKMAIKAMARNPAKKLVIINTSADVRSSMSRQLSAVIDDFDRNRILGSTESCDIVVPRLTESLVRQRSRAAQAGSDGAKGAKTSGRVAAKKARPASS